VKSNKRADAQEGREDGMNFHSAFIEPKRHSCSEDPLRSKRLMKKRRGD